MATFNVGDIVTADALDLLADAPYCSLAQATAQSLPNITDTALTFGTSSTVSDNYGFHSETTNNTRITPSVPGLYQLGFTFFMAAGGTGITYVLLIASIYKN